MYLCVVISIFGSLCELLFDCGCFFFFFKQKTAYDMRSSDWSSDVCSSDLSWGMGLDRRPVEKMTRARERHQRPKRSSENIWCRKQKCSKQQFVPRLHLFFTRVRSSFTTPAGCATSGSAPACR